MLSQRDAMLLPLATAVKSNFKDIMEVGFRTHMYLPYNCLDAHRPGPHI